MRIFTVILKRVVCLLLAVARVPAPVYSTASFPAQEKLTFWNQIDSVFSSLDSEAVVRSEIHLLDALLAKEKLISEEAAVFFVSSEVVGMVEKDRAPNTRGNNTISLSS